MREIGFGILGEVSIFSRKQERGYWKEEEKEERCWNFRHLGAMKVQGEME